MAPFENLAELVLERAGLHPDEALYTFLTDGEVESHTLTFGDVALRAQAIAAELQARVAPGSRALLIYAPGVEFIGGFLGCQLAGVIAVPVYPPRQPTDIARVAAIVKDSGAAAILTQKEYAVAVEASLEAMGAGALVVLATDGVDLGSASAWRMPALGPQSLSFLQYTSGSTGTPKGVMVSHANLLHNERQIHQTCGTERGLVVVSWLPQYHDMGLIGGILQPLYMGGHCVLMSPFDFLQRPIRWLEAMSKYRAGVSTGPNFSYELCARRATDEDVAKLDLSPWRVALNGAEPIRLSTLDRFCDRFAPCGFRRETFFPCYGLAEATLIVTGSGVSELPHTLHVDAASLEKNTLVAREPDAPGSRALVGSGREIDLPVRIVDPSTLERCEDGAIGEIWVRGESVAQGYWGRPEATQEVFHAHIAGTNEGPFLRTGDLGVFDGTELFVTGRLKELIIVDGRNHYPQDIEETVQRGQAALRSGCGTAFSVDVDGAERLVIVQEIAKGHEGTDLVALSAVIRANVAEKHGITPHAIALVTSGTVLKTSSGKLRRRRMRELFVAGSLKSAHTSTSVVAPPPRPARAPRSSAHEMERLVAKLVAAKAGVAAADLDLTTPFSSLGIDSLSLVTLSGELQEALGRRLEPQIFYTYSTIAQLARFLAGDGERTPESIAETTLAPASREPIAIVGMACRFPGAPDLEAYWRLLASGTDAIREVPSSRWDLREWFDPDPSAGGKMATRWGGFIDGEDLFDADFFGVPAREAAAMDPQQRLLLELTWHALEEARLVPARLRGSRTGVYVGISGNDYGRLQSGTAGLLAPNAGTGNALSIAANRLSYFFDWKGPSLAVDTACSSALTAVHEAALHLAAGECDLAVVGAVNLVLAPDVTVSFSQARMMAADGRCKAFSAKADGYVRGEGGGVLVLKRLSEAISAGDPIWGVLAGSACTQDGRSNGLTAPNGRAQQATIEEALRRAGWRPADVQVVETHGTGTRLGDPIEAEALGAAYGHGRSAEAPLVLGAVKSQVGHLESAAGMAGIIKMALAMRHGVVPANLHCAEVNPLVSLDAWKLALPRESLPWPRGERRRAGVSAFGFGGTNVHVLIEEAPDAGGAPPQSTLAASRPIHVLPLSARSKSALERTAAESAALLASGADGAALCHTAGLRRQHFREARRAVIGASANELSASLAHPYEAPARPAKRGVAFLFTGQGAQYIKMGRGLYESHPEFRAILDECDTLQRRARVRGLLEVLYPTVDDSQAAHALAQTENAQPALYAIEYALAALYRSWGVEPAVMMGHSVGEFAAAATAGVFSFQDGLALVEARGRLMQGVPVAGGMLAVFAHERDVEPLLARVDRRLSIGAYNGPGQLVLSGALPDLDTARVFLAQRGIEAKPLKVSHAFHSPLMQPMIDDFRRVAESVTFHEPLVPIVSNLSGRAETKRLASAEYWVEHVLAPVRFAQGIEHLRQMEVGVLLEIGPRPVLVGMARRVLPPGEFAFLGSLDADKGDWQRVAESLAALYEAGVDVDWERWDAPFAIPHGPAARYSFERKRHWFDAAPHLATGARAPAQHGHPLLGRSLVSPRLARGERHYESEVTLPGPAFFRLDPEPIERRVSLLAYLDVALEAQHAFFPGDARHVRHIALEGLLKVSANQPRLMQTLCSPREGGDYGMEVWTRDPNEEWRRIASATLSPGDQAQRRSEPLSVVQARVAEVLDVDAWYKTTREIGLHYWASPNKAIRRLWWAPCEVLAAVTLVEDDDAFSAGLWLKHSAWHACNQVMGAICPRDGRGTYFPISLDRFHFFSEPGKHLFIHARLLEHEVDSSRCKLDVFVYGEDGALVAEICGATMIPDETQRRPREEWRNTKVDDRPQLLAEALRLAASWVFKRPPEEVPLLEPLSQLGLDSLGALDIATSVERMFEVGIDLAQLQQGASILQLAATLEARLAEAEGSATGTTTASSPLVEIHRGDASLAPLFLVHPTGGTVFCYQELARHLGSQPVVGVQSTAAGGSADLEPLEARATRYLRAIRERQPHGPYMLGGWSMGGVLAFEMARQLEAAREEVGSLILLDAPAPGRAARVAPSDVLRLFAQGLGIVLDEGTIASFEPHRDATLDALLRAIRAQRPSLQMFGVADLRRWLAEFERNFAALRAYEGGAYSGNATLLCAETPLDASRPNGTGADWGRWLATADVIRTMPGDHFSLLSGSHVMLTASYVRKALRAMRGSQAAIRIADRALPEVYARAEAHVVIAAPVRSREGASRAELVVDETHPYFFDHPLDHVTGMHLIEGMLQLIEASEASTDRYVRTLRVTFPRFCEKDRPTTLEIAPTIEGDLRTCRALQDKVPVCVMKFQTDRAPERAETAARVGAIAPANAKLLHKVRGENVLIGAWRVDGTLAQAPLLEPPADHQLASGDPRGYSPLYLLEATRQLVTGLAHAESRVPLGTPMNLVAVEFLLHAPIPRGVALRLEHEMKPMAAASANQFSHFEVMLKHGDQTLAECRLTAQLMSMETYLRVRRQRNVVAA